ADAEVIKSSDRIILPGVGAFEDAAKKLRESGLDKVIIDEAVKGKKLMGICLGMQMLFEKSYEYGCHKGLGLLKGSIVPMQDSIPANLKIPHIGWNALHFTRESYLFKYIKNNDCVYFVHSFYADECSDSVISTAEYGNQLTAAVQKGNIMGCQFHPEKSGEVGLNILRAFCEME
ncbi:MAG: imidazole glycerol phosphate synthase subunit HisH, partial [Clostridia bacterium]|nr:imidazole glycerol phosphate synthase subunit HisH [Clostridia bacterium]